MDFARASGSTLSASIRVMEKNAITRGTLTSQIYRKASRVMIWPGEVVDHEVPSASWSELARLQGSYDPGTIALKPGALLILIEKVGSSSYWSRTWIIQEIYLARKLDLIVGSEVADFWNFAALCHHIPGPIVNGDKQFRLVCSWSRESRVRLTLAQCTSIILESQCHDQRDRIYSVLGMYQELQFLPVDYQGDQYSLMLDVCAQLQPTFMDNFQTLAQVVGPLLESMIVAVCKHRLEIELYNGLAASSASNRIIQALMKWLRDSRPNMVLVQAGCLTLEAKGRWHNGNDRFSFDNNPLIPETTPV